MGVLEDLKKKVENKKKPKQTRQVYVAFPLIQHLRQRIALVRQRIAQAYQENPNFRSHVDNFMQKHESKSPKAPKKVEKKPNPSYIM